MSDDLFTLFATRLRTADIEAVVTGGVAAMVYGQPRMVESIELLVTLEEERVEALAAAFDEEGFVRPPLALMRLEARRPTRGRVTIIHRETELWADLMLAGEDPLHRWAQEGAREVVVHGTTLRIAPPEHVVVTTLDAMREHDRPVLRRDVRTILQQHGDQLDRTTIASEIVRLGLQPQWTRIIEELKAP